MTKNYRRESILEMYFLVYDIFLLFLEFLFNVHLQTKNKKRYEIIARAEKWLENNTYENELLKWETKAWGENPADFGRK